MEMIKPQEATDRYGHFMRRIWFRVDVIARCEAGSRGVSMTGCDRTDIDLCYLQLRKCLELVLFASVLAHDSFGHELEKGLKDKQWKPGKIINQLRQVNPRFYPIPGKATQTTNSESPNFMRLEEGYLTESDFVEVYGRCGDWLHSKRKDPYCDLNACWDQIEDYTSKLVKLLSIHWIHLTEELLLLVEMPTELSGEVEVTIASPDREGNSDFFIQS